MSANKIYTDPKLMGAGAMAALIVVKFISKGEMATYVGIGQLIGIALSGGIGFVLGWLFSPHAKQFRVLVGCILAGLLFLIGIGDSGPSGMGIMSLFAMVAFVVGFSYWLGGALRAFTARPTTFGSAEWASLDHLEEHNVVGQTGIRLGTFNTEDGTVPLHYESDRHLLTIAPTRSGKGTTAIIPNLLTYRGSALVIDPKGENAMITAAQRTSMGQNVHIVDPWCITGNAQVARFNPLDWLQIDDIDITENAMLLADALVLSDNHADSFWMEEAKALLQGIIRYVATDEREAGHRHLGRVRDLLLLDGEDMKALFNRMLESHHH